MVDYSKPIRPGQEPGLSCDPDRRASADEPTHQLWSLGLGFCLLLLSLFLLFIVIPMSAKAESSDQQVGLTAVAAHAVESTANSNDAEYSSGWIPEIWFSETWHWLVPFAVLLVLPLALRWLGANRRSLSKRLTASGTGSDMSSEAECAAENDELTGLANMRKFDSTIDRAWEKSLHKRQPICVVVIGLNRLHQHGEIYGRAASDHLLCAVASALSPVADGAGGLLARYDREELIALLPGQDLAGGVRRAEAMLEVIVKLGFNSVLNESGSITTSFGVASSMPGSDLSPRELVKSAVQALNRAKRKGPDQIEATDNLLIVRTEPVTRDQVQSIPSSF